MSDDSERELPSATFDSLTPIAVIGLGYVGLPLAVAFGEKRPVIGFDINFQRIAQLQQGCASRRISMPFPTARCLSLPSPRRWMMPRSRTSRPW